LKARRAGIFVETRNNQFSSSVQERHHRLEFKLQLVRVSDTLKRELQPGNMPLLNGAWDFLRGGGYKDAAPTALKQNRYNL